MKKILFIIFLIFLAFQFYIRVWIKQDYPGQYIHETLDKWLEKKANDRYDKAYKDLMQMLDVSSGCEKDSDCVIVPASADCCSIGVCKAINKKYSDAYLEKFSKIREMLGPCTADCFVSPEKAPEYTPMCRNNKCACVKQSLR